ncbi:MAG TPA: flagellar hook-length control protein FliK [Blastocatellia bacterium]|nr:flagellar hook-length control protein FliK [Blastocatellia bacterium]
MPDITGMMALPDREQPARDTEADGAPPEEFAAMLAAMSLPVVTTPAADIQTAAAPESASSVSIEVTAIAAPASGLEVSLPETLTESKAPAPATRQTEIAAETSGPQPSPSSLSSFRKNSSIGDEAVSQPLPSSPPSEPVTASETDSPLISAPPVAVTTTHVAVETFSELTGRQRQADSSSNSVRPNGEPQAQTTLASRPAPPPAAPLAQAQPAIEAASLSFGKAKASEQAKDASRTDRPAELPGADSAPVREPQPALNPEPERGGLIRRVIEESARTQPEQPVVAAITNQPLPTVPVRHEAVKSSPAVRVQRQPEAEQQKTGRVSAPADARPEIAGQNRSLKAALRPLIVELRQPQRETVQSQTDEFSVPESPLPVTISSHLRAEEKIETTAHTEAQTIIGQAAEPVINAAASLAPREARTLRLTLNPQELGQLEVRLTRDEDGRVSATFTADRETTRQALSAGLSELRQTLERAGLPVDRLEIRHAPQPELTGQFTSNPHGQPRQPFHEQPASDRFAALQPSREALNENPTVTPTVITDRLLSRRA